jgi:hypothetical protein
MKQQERRQVKARLVTTKQQALRMAHAYAEQLDAIGDILVRAKVITRRDIRRQGVQFAIRDKFAPPARAAKRAHT